ncbi:NAC domain-containing protein 83-like [Corylus avellana]|uniref:NAC domain-containing protein 83-like n=1 Tax=Corylus avellana TaxID=13451 RepID=UPI00286CB565|nr:NAC domain-containing protein 83-like [Corylus avellana]
MMDSVEEYFKILPPGYKFCSKEDELIRSKEDELIRDYLKPKVFNEPLPPNPITDDRSRLIVEANMMYSVEEYFKILRPGYKFCSKEDELIRDYLKPKVFNEHLPPNPITNDRSRLIVGANMKDSVEEYFKILPPGYKLCPNDAMVFNEPLPPYPNINDKKYISINLGIFQVIRDDKQVKDAVNTIIGFKKSLVFYNGKPGHVNKTKWIMHEYTINDPPPNKTGENDMTLDDLILCRIYKKIDKGKTCTQDDQQPMKMIGPVDDKMEL